MNAAERNQRLKERNERIRARFIEFSNKRLNNKARIYSKEAILQMVAEEFYLAPRTIENIVFS